MTATLAIARRELASYLLSPVGYLLIALFLFFTSLVFFVAAPLLVRSGFSQGQPASLRMFFEASAWVFFLVGPAISMRSISEELRLGTLETLLTAPLSDAQIILGKFAGCFAFLVVMLAPTAVYVVVLERFGRPDYGEVASGYIGLLLVGAAYLASGILASSMTSSQVLAYVTTVFFWIILLLATIVLPVMAGVVESMAGRPGNGALLERLIGWAQPVGGFLAAGNPVARLRGFIVGLVDTFNVVYFVSFTIVFLVAATRSLGLRRCP